MRIVSEDDSIESPTSARISGPNMQVFPLRRPGFEMGKCGVGVFPVNSFVVNPVANRTSLVSLTAFNPGQSDDIATTGSVIPIQFICGDKVDSHGTRLLNCNLTVRLS